MGGPKNGVLPRGFLLKPSNQQSNILRTSPPFSPRTWVCLFVRGYPSFCWLPYWAPPLPHIRGGGGGFSDFLTEPLDLLAEVLAQHLVRLVQHHKPPSGTGRGADRRMGRTGQRERKEEGRGRLLGVSPWFRCGVYHLGVP